MPTTLGPKYSITWRGRPPHMLEPDIPVWYRFLDKYGFLFTALYYDCLLGGPWYDLDQMQDPLLKMWRYNTAKRADAIAELKDQTWIIEVADQPGLRAMGQLKVYEYLWNEDPKIFKPLQSILVSERVDTDLAASMGKAGFQIYIV